MNLFMPDLASDSGKGSPLVPHDVRDKRRVIVQSDLKDVRHASMASRLPPLSVATSLALTFVNLQRSGRTGVYSQDAGRIKVRSEQTPHPEVLVYLDYRRPGSPQSTGRSAMLVGTALRITEWTVVTGYLEGSGMILQVVCVGYRRSRTVALQFALLLVHSRHTQTVKATLLTLI
jgi:hypothetical protein